jgi:imidazolonepropionase-like amidohydrolase
MRVFILVCFAAFRIQAEDLVLRNATVYPSPEAQPLTKATIVIHDGRITAVVSGATAAFPKDARILDCSGKFITAGFWNSHVHIFTPGLLRARDGRVEELNEQLDAMLNRWGFTTVFDIASVLENTLALRSRINSSELRGPRILTVGEPLWTETPVYVREYLVQNHILMPAVTTPEEAVSRVRKQVQQGADGIKLFTGSMQGEGKVANMPLAEARAAVEEAHRYRLPVFAHPQNSTGLEVAIAGGVDILAHTAPDSPPWSPDFVARLKQAHLALIPTLTLFDFEARKGAVPEEGRQQWLDKMTSELRAFSQGGGEVLFGTDVGYTDHFDTELEFKLMAQSGMNFRQILASLTTNPARRFNDTARSGRISSGMAADLTVLKSDPAQDISALSKIQLTIKGGRIIYSAN